MVQPEGMAQFMGRCTRERGRKPGSILGLAEGIVK